MKRVFIVCLLAIGMMAEAQTNQIITKKLQLNNVPAGSTTDKVLVRGLDKVVKEVTMSSGIADAPSDGTSYNRKDGSWVNAGSSSPTLQDVLTSGKQWVGNNSQDTVDFGANGYYFIGKSENPNSGSFINQTSSIIQLNSHDSTNNIASDVFIKRQSLVLSNTNFGPYSGLRIVGDEGIVFEQGGTNDGTQVALNSTNITGSRNQQFTDASGNISIINTTAPASATATGKVGEIRVTSTYIYVCTATNTWVRSAVNTW